MVHTTRQRRGYTFETDIVKQFNKGNWKARRLGGSSSGLPDVGITNNTSSILYAIEAKSTVYNFLEIPLNQIIRCMDYLDLYSIYQKKNVILAFRFASKHAIRNVNSIVKITRPKPVYFFFIVTQFKQTKKQMEKEIYSVTCNSKGKLTLKIKNFDPEKEYDFDDYMDIDKVTTIEQLKLYGWDSKQSNFDHIFTV